LYRYTLVAFPYLTLINNFSQAWAMYCLILFYKVTHEAGLYKLNAVYP
jgi:hypothetical protein